MLYNYLNRDDKKRVIDSNYNRHHSSSHPDRILSTHDLIYIYEGDWCIAQDDVYYTVTSGDVILLQSNHHHYGPFPSTNTVKTIFIEFSSCSLDFVAEDEKNNVSSNSYKFPIVVHCQNHPQVYAHFKQVVSHFWADEWFEKAKSSAYLDLLLCELSGCWNREISITDEIKKLFRETPYRFISNQELENIFHCSVKTISTKFKKDTGETLHAWQVKQKCQMARELIFQNPSVTLKELAAIYGFYDEYHFSKAYKKIYGHSPKSTVRLTP